MKQFLKKLLLFALIPIGVCLLVYCIFAYTVHQELKNYDRESGLKTLFVGDSHIQMTFDAQLLPHSANLARDSEGFKYCLLKIKKILEVNPDINKIYLGFSYHNISSNYDDVIDGKMAYHISSRYFFILPASEKIKILKQNAKNLSPLLIEIFKSGLKASLKYNHYCYYGYYTNSFASSSVVKSSVDKRINYQYYKNHVLSDFSNVNIADFKKIIKFCKSKNIELAIVNTPLNAYYRSKIPKKFIDEYAKIIRQNHLNLIDMSEVTLTDSCYIPDGDHVSKKGSIFITNQFKTISKLNDKKVEKFNKPEQYD